MFAFSNFFLSSTWLQSMIMRVAIFIVTITALMVHRLAMQDDILFLPSYSLVMMVVIAFEANLYH